MAKTNFAALLDEQKQVWSRDVWKTARQNSFVMQLSGTGPNAVFQRITELTKDERGDRANITLVSDLENDGVTGDYTLEDNEEAIKAHDQQIVIDQLRNANRTTGKMNDQKTVVKFRATSKDVLGFWLADRTDQLAILTLSGVDYRQKTDGGFRKGFTHDGADYVRDTTPVTGAPVGQALYDLAFAASVTAPSAKRHFRWNGPVKVLSSANTTAVTAADTPSYAMLVEAKAYAKQRRLRSVKAGAGAELYHVLMHPKAVAKLKLDQDFLANLRSAGTRGNSNPLFSGALVTVDGLVIHEYVHVFNTLGAATGTATEAGRPGYKWGSTAAQNGSRTLILGAQALGIADLGGPEWDERNHFDYGNQSGIAIGKIMGFLKPVFYSYQDGTNEDFGVLAIDHAI